MTVYKAIKPEAEDAAELAVAVAQKAHDPVGPHHDQRQQRHG